MAAEPTKVFSACDIKNGFGASRRSDAIEGARRWCPVLGTVFANLWPGKRSVQPTVLANTPGGDRPITVRDGLLQDACEAPVAFALALRVALMEFEDEMRKQGVGLTTETEYWAYVGGPGNGQRRGISNGDHDRGSKKSRSSERKATKCANSG